MPAAPFRLPTMLGEECILSALVEERSDSILYLATQKDLQREVWVESLLSQEEGPRTLFFQRVKAQLRLCLPEVAAVWELLEEGGCLHLLRERIQGESLDMLAPSGRVLAPLQLCRLMEQLCRICLYMDLEGIASDPFALRQLYLVEQDFRFDNIAAAGLRSRSASCDYLMAAASALLPLLEANGAGAAPLRLLLQRLAGERAWSSLSVQDYRESFLLLRCRLSQPGDAASPSETAALPRA